MGGQDETLGNSTTRFERLEIQYCSGFCLLANGERGCKNPFFSATSDFTTEARGAGNRAAEGEERDDRGAL